MASKFSSLKWSGLRRKKVKVKPYFISGGEYVLRQKVVLLETEDEIKAAEQTVDKFNWLTN